MIEQFRWSDVKDAALKDRHGIGFGRIVEAVAGGGLVDDRGHPNLDRYPHQRQMIVRLDGQYWVVPYVRDGDILFLKTMFPGRVARAQYGKDDT